MSARTNALLLGLGGCQGRGLGEGAAWEDAGLDRGDLHEPGIGGTIRRSVDAAGVG